MGSEKLKDLPKVMQSLSPSPSDSRATSCPATWSCGSFPREPRSSVLGRVKEANEAPVPPVHGEEWLALSQLCREAAAARRFGSSSRAPTRLLPPALGRVSSAQCLSPLGEVPTIPPTRAPGSEGSPSAERLHMPKAPGSRLWAASGAESQGHTDPGKREERSEKGGPWFWPPAWSGRPQTLPQTFSTVAPTASSRDALVTGKPGVDGRQLRAHLPHQMPQRHSFP